MSSMEVEARCILLSPWHGCGKHGIGDFLVGAGREDISKNSSVAVEGSRTPYQDRLVDRILVWKLDPDDAKNRECAYHGLPRASQKHFRRPLHESSIIYPLSYVPVAPAARSRICMTVQQNSILPRSTVLSRVRRYNQEPARRAT